MSLANQYNAKRKILLQYSNAHCASIAQHNKGIFIAQQRNNRNPSLVQSCESQLLYRLPYRLSMPKTKKCNQVIMPNTKLLLQTTNAQPKLGLSTLSFIATVVPLMLTSSYNLFISVLVFCILFA